VKCKVIFFLLLIQSALLYPDIMPFTAAGQTATAAESLNYELLDGGTVAIIPLNSSSVTAARELVQQVQTSNVVHVAAMVYAPPAAAPYMVLSGSPPDLQQALSMLGQLLPNQTPEYLIVIAASLQELTHSRSNYIGLNPVPGISGKGTVDWNKTGDSPRVRTGTQYLEANSSDILALNAGLNNSKVLVSSEVYTPNGIKAQISNIKSVPVFSTDTQGNVQTQFQNLETSIAVVPTIIEYNGGKPEESIVRVDVDVRVSIISGSSTFKSVSAPEYSSKTMTTTRMLPADNQRYIIGTFITDSDTKNTSGIPILSKIPLLKYLFSQEHIDKQRNTAVLTLAVRLLPLPSAAQAR
jgi:type II secretory pathway component GspD/PulD (secretin)